MSGPVTIQATLISASTKAASEYRTCFLWRNEVLTWSAASSIWAATSGAASLTMSYGVGEAVASASKGEAVVLEELPELLLECTDLPPFNRSIMES